MLVVVLPLGFLLKSPHPVGQGVASLGFALLGFAAMIALMGRLQLFMAAIYIDREGPLASLKSSWRLTQRHWWRAMVILTTALIMMLVLYLALSMLSYLSGYLTHYGPAQRFVIGPLLLAATYTTIYPLGAAVWVAMYNDFKLRREGGDLAARVGALTSV